MPVDAELGMVVIDQLPLPLTDLERVAPRGALP